MANNKDCFPLLFYIVMLFLCTPEIKKTDVSDNSTVSSKTAVLQKNGKLCS